MLHPLQHRRLRRLQMLQTPLPWLQRHRALLLRRLSRLLQVQALLTIPPSHRRIAPLIHQQRQRNRLRPPCLPATGQSRRALLSLAANIPLSTTPNSQQTAPQPPKLIQHPHPTPPLLPQRVPATPATLQTAHRPMRRPPQALRTPRQLPRLRRLLLPRTQLPAPQQQLLLKQAPRPKRQKRR